MSWFAIDWTEEGSDVYPGGVVLRDATGKVVRVSLGEGDTDCRPYYEASRDDWIVKALVASEDGTFFSHCGVRPFSILRALCQNVFYRRRISGASTITMQTVRLIRPHRKSYCGKYVEAFRAMKMERRKDKLWIVSQYLNRAPFGSNFVGIEAASSGWFGKGAKELGIGEAALLAGMVQAPSRFRPDRGYDRAVKRRDYVLSRMVKLGFITEEQMEGAKKVFPEVCRAPRPFEHPFYCDWYLREVIGRDRKGDRAYGDYTMPLDPDVQRTCERVVGSVEARCGYSAAAVVMRVAGPGASGPGEVVAVASSGDYFGKGDGAQVNCAVAPRPAGSTLKPFLVAEALETGLVAPDEMLADIPRTYKGYRPANFDAKHRGLVSLRDSLVLSLNIPFVELLGRVGVERFGTRLRETGFAHMNAPDESFGLGMAIGSVEVTLVELVKAYGALARSASGGEGGFDEGAAYIVTDMLSGGERASAAMGHVADVVTSRFAWKTGTSSAYRDAWSVLWNPEYVVGVWCGHLSGGFGDEALVGAKAAAPEAWKIARSLYPRGDGPWFAEPGCVGRREVCALTGLPAGEACPHRVEGRCLRGAGSSRLCGVHVRGFDGRPCERFDAQYAAYAGLIARAERLGIASPEDGATFKVVDGMGQQRIVCRATGAANGERLWWFLDGVPAGETEGSAPLAMEMSCGRHRLTCATAQGVAAESSFTVER